jgi:hypothetical protein
MVKNVWSGGDGDVTKGKIEATSMVVKDAAQINDEDDADDDDDDDDDEADNG